MLTNDLADYKLELSEISQRKCVPYYYRRDQHAWLFTWTGNSVFQVGCRRAQRCGLARVSDCAPTFSSSPAALAATG